MSPMSLTCTLVLVVVTILADSHPLDMANYQPQHAYAHGIDGYNAYGPSVARPTSETVVLGASSDPITVFDGFMNPVSRVTMTEASSCSNQYSGLVSNIKVNLTCDGPGPCTAYVCFSETYTLGAKAKMYKIDMKKGEKKSVSHGRHTNANTCTFGGGKVSITYNDPKPKPSGPCAPPFILAGC